MSVTKNKITVNDNVCRGTFVLKNCDGDKMEVRLKTVHDVSGPTTTMYIVRMVGDNEDGGFSDQNAFVIHRNGNGTILSSKSCNSIRANQYLIPVFDETDNACFLSIKFITANEIDESTVSISAVGLDGNVLKVLVDNARIVSDDKLISAVTDFITNELHIYWDRGIDLGFNMCE